MAPPVKYNKAFIIKEGMLARKTNAEILAEVHAKFPGARTTLVTVSWYRKVMRKEGLDVPTSREAKKEKKVFDDILA